MEEIKQDFNKEHELTTTEFNIGETYNFAERKVKYLGYKTLPNGLKQFQVEYLDNPINNEDWPSAKKGKKEWHGYWQLEKLSKTENKLPKKEIEE